MDNEVRFLDVKTSSETICKVSCFSDRYFDRIKILEFLKNSVVILSALKTQTKSFMLPKANYLNMKGFQNSGQKISWLRLIHISKKNVNSPLGFVSYLWIHNCFVINIEIHSSIRFNDGLAWLQLWSLGPSKLQRVPR